MFRTTIVFIFLFISIIFGKAQVVYTPNTGRGLLTEDDNIISLFSGQGETRSTTQFLYTYLNEVLTDDCILDNGKIDDRILYKTLKAHFDSVLNFDGGVRYVLRVFPTCCSSWEGYSPFLVDDKNTDDGKMLIWYPVKLHKLLMESEFPTTSYRRDISAFKKTKNLSIIDLRSELIYNVYDRVIRAFSLYLEEKLDRRNLSGRKLKKGDFISCIEMGFVGPYGEGRTDFYAFYKDSESLIRIAELYKKYLSDYVLVAPGFGMRNDITLNQNLIPFQKYLLTTSYGKGKEFGLFIDHLGHYNYRLDFTLAIPSIKNPREIASQKYLKAPFIGENSGVFQDESKRILECVDEWHISMCAPWGNLSMENDAVNAWRNAFNKMGYVFSIANDSVSFNGRNVEISFDISNLGVAYCYWDIWQPEIVIKVHNTNKEIAIINISKYLNLTSRIFPIKVSIKKRVIPISRYLRDNKTKYDVYLRIVDKKNISGPIVFADGTEGEYALGNKGEVE